MTFIIIKHDNIDWYFTEYGWSSYEGDADAYTDRKLAEKIAAEHGGKAQAVASCPSCHGWITSHPAISRKDNATPICPYCGMEEAIKALKKEKENK